MNRIIFKIGAFLLIGFSIVGCDIPMNKDSVIGDYANTNYDNEHCCMNSPHKPDTLILNSDGTFSSEFYGTGTYEVSYGISESRIAWTYDYGVDSVIIDTYFNNKVFGNTKIILNGDFNHYYEKFK